MSELAQALTQVLHRVKGAPLEMQAEAIESYLKHSQKYALVRLPRPSIGPGGKNVNCNGRSIPRTATPFMLNSAANEAAGLMAIVRKIASMGRS